jgi:predicted nucleic acid-binding protein
VILVDSSIYVDWLRRRVDPRHALAHWLKSHEVASCGIIRAEVLRGVLDPAQRARVEQFFDVLQEIPTDAKLWRDVAELAWELDRRGIVLAVPDLAIACCAMRCEARLFTLDADFLKIPNLRVRLSAP